MKKTFKIGEYAIGGIITADVNTSTVTITAKDWDTKEVVRSSTFSLDSLFDIEMYLNELTSVYFADKVMDFIKK
jgi:hypothetical protein